MFLMHLPMLFGIKICIASPADTESVIHDIINVSEYSQAEKHLIQKKCLRGLIIRRRNGNPEVLTVIREMMMDSEKRLVCATQAEPNHGEKEKYLSFAPFAPSLARSTYRANQSYGMIGLRVFSHSLRTEMRFNLCRSC